METSENEKEKGNRTGHEFYDNDDTDTAPKCVHVFTPKQNVIPYPLKIVHPESGHHRCHRRRPCRYLHSIDPNPPKSSQLHGQNTGGHIARVSLRITNAKPRHAADQYTSKTMTNIIHYSIMYYPI